MFIIIKEPPLNAHHANSIALSFVNLILKAEFTNHQYSISLLLNRSQTLMLINDEIPYTLKQLRGLLLIIHIDTR